MTGTAEYSIDTTVTATEDIPAAYTGCHSHGEEIFCIAPDGEEVEIHVTGEEEEENSESSPDGVHCHFHAGVE